MTGVCPKRAFCLFNCAVAMDLNDMLTIQFIVLLHFPVEVSGMMEYENVREKICSTPESGSCVLRTCKMVVVGI